MPLSSSSLGSLIRAHEILPCALGMGHMSLAVSCRATTSDCSCRLVTTSQLWNEFAFCEKPGKRIVPEQTRSANLDVPRAREQILQGSRHA